MLVEIVIASVLAMSIAYYLLNLTYKFKNTSEDIYQSYFYMKDKILITKNIMSDLEKGIVYRENITYDATSITFDLYIHSKDHAETRKLLITKGDGTTTIQYGKVDIADDDTVSYDTDDISYYEKDLDSSLIIGDLEFQNIETGITITIPIQSIYDDNDYSIKLLAERFDKYIN